MNVDTTGPSQRPKRQDNRRWHRRKNKAAAQNDGQNSGGQTHTGSRKQEQHVGGGKPEKKEKRIKLVPVSALFLEYRVTN